MNCSIKQTRNNYNIEKYCTPIDYVVEYKQIYGCHDTLEGDKETPFSGIYVVPSLLKVVYWQQHSCYVQELGKVDNINVPCVCPVNLYE